VEGVNTRWKDMPNSASGREGGRRGGREGREGGTMEGRRGGGEGGGEGGRECRLEAPVTAQRLGSPRRKVWGHKPAAGLLQDGGARLMAGGEIQAGGGAAGAGLTCVGCAVTVGLS
jgi:hypothetical protein